MTAAAPVSIASGKNCWAAGPPAMFHRQCSAAHSRQPSAASSAERGRDPAADRVQPGQPQPGDGGPGRRRGRDGSGR